MIRIGLVGFNNNQLNILKKKFPKNKLTNIKDLNDKKYFEETYTLHLQLNVEIY